MWRVSISQPQADGPLVTAKWSRQQKREAQRVTERLLEGVGMEPQEHGLYPFAHHLRRCLTNAEMEMVGPGWCAIPAVDEGGTPAQALKMFVDMGILTPEGLRR